MNFLIRSAALLESIVRFLLSWSFLALVSILFLPVFLLLLPSRRRRILTSNLWGQLVGRIMAFLCGASLPPGIRTALASPQPAIFVANHTSYLDVYLGIWAAPTGTLATARHTTIYTPFIGLIYALSGNILVKRSDKRAAAAALLETIELTRNFRISVWVWAKGTRAAGGRLLPFKRGFAHVALATRLPIVPVVITGAHRCWPRGSPFTQRTFVDIRVLAPIPTTDWSLENLDRHVADVHARFVAALPADQQPLMTPSFAVKPGSDRTARALPGPNEEYRR